MADDYLGRKMEDHLARTTVKRRPAVALNDLLARNQPCRDYDASFAVRADQLRRMVGVKETVPEARAFEFRCVLSDEAPAVMKCAGDEFAAAPNAFVVVCSVTAESRSTAIDLGIAVQSMSLKAVESGLNCLRIDNFDREALAAELDLEFEPLLILAVGRSAKRAANASTL